MRKIVFHLQTTLNNRIANADGEIWEPFFWGEEETDYLNEQLRRFDTWVLGRIAYETIIPWWDSVAAGEIPEGSTAVTAADREFARLQKNLTKVVFSTTLQPSADRTVIASNLVEGLTALKQQDGKDILLSCGPATLAPIANTPGLIDEFLMSLNPVVLSSGPGVFDGLTRDLTLELTDSKIFAAGAVVLRYKVR